MIQPNAILERNHQVAYRRMSDGQGLLLHLQTTQYHGLNGMGNLIWELLEQGAMCERLVRDICARLEEAPNGVETDIRSFLEDLLRRDLIKVRVA